MTTTTPEEPVVHDKLEVGWLFVQQYYMHLNEQPHRLHLFYTKKSTLCHGTEGEEIASYQGQTQIQQRIKEHNFEDCKVVISNMDCQESADGGVVVQVLGEMSNRGKPSQKFVQTFFLASQPRGYFVLNDIFRFLKEDVPEFEEPADNTVYQNGHHQVDAGTPNSAPVPVAQVNGDAEPQQHHHQESSLFSQSLTGTSGSVTPNEGVAPKETKPEPIVEKAELLTTWAPTTLPAQAAAVVAAATVADSAASIAAPAATQPAKAKQQPTQPTSQLTQPAAQTILAQPVPATPAAPVSWAAMAAKNTAKKEALASNGLTVTSPVPNSTTSSSATAQQPPAAVNSISTASTAASAKQNGGQQQSSSRKIPEYHSAYIKHVSPRVDDALLKKALDNIGVVTHFQVEKSKNCAFVDFVDETTLKAALAVHELHVGDQIVLIEERKRGGAKKNIKKTSNNKKPTRA